MENSAEISAFAYYDACSVHTRDLPNINKRKNKSKNSAAKKQKISVQNSNKQFNYLKGPIPKPVKQNGRNKNKENGHQIKKKTSVKSKPAPIVKVTKTPKIKTNNQKKNKTVHASKTNNAKPKQIKRNQPRVAGKSGTRKKIAHRKRIILRQAPKPKPKSKPERQKCSSGYFYLNDIDSVNAGQNMMSWIMQPVDLKEFFKENWEKHPISIQRRCPEYYSHILTCEDIDKALRKEQLYFTKNIDITSYSPETGLRETHNPPGRATAPLVWDFYANGCSIRILNPQTYFPRVHALNAALQEYFGCFVGANAYLTPAGSQGFAPHYDDIEAFVIQLEGEKMWRLYAPRNSSEKLPRFSSGNFTDSDLGPPILEVLLKQGDLMYFPRGFIHQGAAVGNTHSLHITLSVYQKNSWADLLEILLPAALKSAIEEDVSFRKGLPMHFLSNLGLVHSDKTSKIRTKFMQTLQNLMTKLVDFAPVDAAVDQIGKKFIHDSLPPFLWSDDRETTVYGDGERIKNGEVHNQAEMCLGTRIKLIRYNCIRMLREEDSIRIYHSVGNSKEYHEEDAQFLEIDEHLAPAIDAIIFAYPEYIAVEDLPINDDIEKVQIATDLWECGILKTEEPLSYESD